MCFILQETNYEHIKHSLESVSDSKILHAHKIMSSYIQVYNKILLLVDTIL